VTPDGAARHLVNPDLDAQAIADLASTGAGWFVE
jgi:hypothetical protein